MNAIKHSYFMACAVIVILLCLNLKTLECFPTTTGPYATEETPASGWTEIEVEVTEPTQNDAFPSETNDQIIMTAITQRVENIIEPDQIVDDLTTTETTVEVLDDDNVGKEEESAEFTTSQPPLDQKSVDPDKNEILSELQSIWHYTEELGDDQNELKSSLASLVHMTYARVYDQTDETLIRLKYLLRRLRTRLLDDPNSNDVQVKQSQVNPIPSQIPSENVKESGTLKTDEQIPAVESQDHSARKRRSFPDNDDSINRGYNYKYNASLILASANPDENSLFPLKQNNNDPDPDRFSYTMVSKNNSVKHPTAAVTSSTVDDMDNDDGFVKVTITAVDPMPTNLKNLTTPTPLAEPVTLYQKKNSTDDEFYDTTPFFQASADFDKEPTLDNIIQSIIDILKRPIQKPTLLSKPMSQIALHFIDPPQEVNATNPLDDLPSYIHKLALGMLSTNELPSSDLKQGLAKINATENNSTSEASFSQQLAAGTNLTSTDFEAISQPTTVLNGTMEKVLEIVGVYTNLPNASRLVLFFSLGISVLSIALGLYSLGPPIVAVGVLGIIFPVFLLFVFQSRVGKRKASKIDNLFDNLNSDDFYKALNLLVDAIEKYETSHKRKFDRKL